MKDGKVYREIAVVFARAIPPWGREVTRKRVDIETNVWGVILIPRNEPNKPTLIPWNRVEQLALEVMEPEDVRPVPEPPRQTPPATAKPKAKPKRGKKA